MQHEPDLLRRERPLRFLAEAMTQKTWKATHEFEKSTFYGTDAAERERERERVKFNVKNIGKGHRQCAAAALANFVAHEQVCKC
jgi:hypothetical protein